MSDYSYYVVTQEPPSPRVGPWLWLLSWARPIEGWTAGRGYSDGRDQVARREWAVHKGRAHKVGIDHVCGDTKTCRCVTSRTFR